MLRLVARAARRVIDKAHWSRSDALASIVVSVSS